MSASKEQVLVEVAALLQKASLPTPEADAAEIVRVAYDVELDTPREQALTWARRRALGMPLAYVVGRTSFMGLELLVEPGALIPRKETEVLGRAALRFLAERRAARPDRPLRVIDMCCGIGNLACALVAHLPTAFVWASDLTDSCVGTARRNVFRLRLGSRVKVVQGDLFSELSRLGLEETIDLVVCNPPYISTTRLSKDRAGLLDHEPREAFDGGPYGLSIHQRVMREAQPFLRPDGVLMFEFGLGQERQLEILFARSGVYERFRTFADEAGAPRVATGRMKAESAQAMRLDARGGDPATKVSATLPRSLLPVAR